MEFDPKCVASFRPDGESRKNAFWTQLDDVRQPGFLPCLEKPTQNGGMKPTSWYSIVRVFFRFAPMGKVEKTRFERNWTTFVNPAFCPAWKSPLKMVVWNRPRGIRSQGCCFVSPRCGKSKKRVLNAIGRRSSTRLFALLGKAHSKWWYETDLVVFDNKGVFSFRPDGESRKNAFWTQLDDVRQRGFLPCLEKPTQNGGMKPTSWNLILRVLLRFAPMGKVEKTRFERNWTTFVNPAFCPAWKSPLKMVVWNRPRGIRSQVCCFVSPWWGKSKKRVLNAIGRRSSTRLFALLGKAHSKWWYETDLVVFDNKGVFSFRPDGESRKNAFWTQLDDVRQRGFLPCLEKPTQNGGMKPTSWNSIPRVFFRFAPMGKVEKTRFERNWTTFVNPAFCPAWKSPLKMVAWNRPRRIRSQWCFFVSPGWGKSKKRVLNAIGGCSSTRRFALLGKAHSKWWHETDLVEFDPNGVFSFRPDGESRKTRFERNWTTFVNPAFCPAWKSPLKMVVWNRPRGIRSQGCCFVSPRCGKSKKRVLNAIGRRSSTRLFALLGKAHSKWWYETDLVVFDNKGVFSFRPDGESRKNAFWTQLDDVRQRGFLPCLEKPTQNGGMKPTSWNSIPRVFFRFAPMGKVEKTRFERNWTTFVNPAFCPAWKSPLKMVAWNRPRRIRSQWCFFVSPGWGKSKKRVLNAIGGCSSTRLFALLGKAHSKWWYQTDLVELDPKGVFSFRPDGESRKTRFERNWTTFVNPAFCPAWKSPLKMVVSNRPRGIRSQGCCFVSPRWGKSKKRVLNAIGRRSSTRLFALLEKAHSKWWYETDLVEFDPKGVLSFRPDGESRKNAFWTQLDDVREPGFLPCLEKPTQNGGMKPTSWNSIPRLFFRFAPMGKLEKRRFERNWTTFVNPAFFPAWKSQLKMVAWNRPSGIRPKGVVSFRPDGESRKNAFLTQFYDVRQPGFLPCLEKPTQNGGMKPTSRYSIIRVFFRFAPMGKVEKTRFERNWTTFVNPAFCPAWKSPLKMVVWNRALGIRSQGCFFVSPRWGKSKKRVLNAIGRRSSTRLFALLGKAHSKWWYETDLVEFDPKGVFSFRPDGESRKTRFERNWTTFVNPAFCPAWKSPLKMVVWNRPRGIRSQGCCFVSPRMGKSKKRVLNAIGRRSSTRLFALLGKAHSKWWYETDLVVFYNKGVFSFRSDGESRKNAFWTQFDDVRKRGFLPCLEKPTQNGGMKPTSWNSIPRVFFRFAPMGKVEKTRFERNWTTFVNPAFCPAWKSPLKMVAWNRLVEFDPNGVFSFRPDGESRKNAFWTQLEDVRQPGFLPCLEKPTQNGGIKPTSWNSIPRVFFRFAPMGKVEKRVLNAIGRRSSTRLFALLGKAHSKWWYETDLVEFDPKGVVSFRPDGESRKNAFWTQLDDVRQPGFLPCLEKPTQNGGMKPARRIRSQWCFFVSPGWGKSKKRVLNAIGGRSSTRLFALLGKAHSKWWYQTDLVEFDPKGVFSFRPDGESRKTRFERNWTTFVNPAFCPAWKSPLKMVVWNRPRGIRSQGCCFVSPRWGKSKKRVLNAIGRSSSTRLFALLGKAHSKWWYQTDLVEFDPKCVFSFRPDGESRKTRFERNWTTFVNPAFFPAWKSQLKMVEWNRPRGIRFQGCCFVSPRWGKSKKRVLSTVLRRSSTRLFALLGKAHSKWWYETDLVVFKNKGVFSFRPDGESRKNAFWTQLGDVRQPGFLPCLEKPTQNGGMKPTSWNSIPRVLFRFAPMGKVEKTRFERNWTKFVNPAFCPAWKSQLKMVVSNRPRGIRSHVCFFVLPRWGKSKNAFWTQLDDVRQPGFFPCLEKPTQNGGMKPTSWNSIPRVLFRFAPMGKVEKTRFEHNFTTFVNTAFCLAWKSPLKMVVWNRPRGIQK